MIFDIFKKKKDGRNVLIKEIKSFRFTSPEKLINLIQPALLISEQSGNCKIGTSKYGGKPDLPDSLDWPSFEGRSMVFIGQLNLSEINKYNSGLQFPTAGVLSFFIHFNEPEDEFGAEYDFFPTQEEYKVLYHEDIVSLNSKEFPSDLIDKYKFGQRKLSFNQDFQIPATDESSFVINSDLEESDKNIIFDFAHRYSDGFMDQVGGFPVPIQQGADLDWAYSSMDESSENKFELAKKIGQTFVNVFSFNLDYNFEEIGDSKCYFGITKENLAMRKFEETILIIQDT